MAKKKLHKIRIDHHKDKSHTTTRHHKHEDGSMSSESSAHHDLDGVHDSIHDHLNVPTEGDSQLDQGMHGIPPEQAGPAGIPMPPAPGQAGA